MAKAAIQKMYSLSAKGILGYEDGKMIFENGDTGDLIPIEELLKDFAEKSVSLSIKCDEEY